MMVIAMPRFTMIFLLSSLTLLSSCHRGNSSASTPQSAVSVSDTHARKCSLSAEDLFYLNQRSPEILQKIADQLPLSIDDVIKMYESGVTPHSMMLIIDYTKTRFELNTNDVIRLQIEGIPFNVINHMIQS